MLAFLPGVMSLAPKVQLTFFPKKSEHSNHQFNKGMGDMGVWVQPQWYSKCCKKASHNLFAGGGSYLQFVEHTTPVKHNGAA